MRFHISCSYIFLFSGHCLFNIQGREFWCIKTLVYGTFYKQCHNVNFYFHTSATFYTIFCSRMHKLKKYVMPLSFSTFCFQTSMTFPFSPCIYQTSFLWVSSEVSFPFSAFPFPWPRHFFKLLFRLSLCTSTPSDINLLHRAVFYSFSLF